MEQYGEEQQFPDDRIVIHSRRLEFIWDVDHYTCLNQAFLCADDIVLAVMGANSDDRTITFYNDPQNSAITTLEAHFMRTTN
ncbi:hypothetical protein PFISCL1PPCAC_17096, partial [Pristionchus fissidentatus]